MAGQPKRRAREAAAAGGAQPGAPAASTDLATLISSLGGQAETLELWRFSPQDNTPYFVCPTSLQGFDLNWVRQNLGGGRFAVDAINRSTGVRKVVRRFEFAVEGAPKPYTGDQHNAAVTGTVTNPASMGLQDLNTALISTVVASLGGMAKAMLDMSKVGKADGPDPVMMLLVKAVIDKVFAGDANKPQTFAEQIAALKTLYELGEELRPEPAPPLPPGQAGTFVAALQTVAPALNAIAQKITGMPVAGADGAPPQLPAGGESAEEPVSIADQIAGLVPYLTDKARKGADPAVVAARVIEELVEDVPAPQMMLLSTMAQSETFVAEMFTKMAPTIPPELHDWARAFLSAARDRLVPPTRRRKSSPPPTEEHHT